MPDPNAVSPFVFRLAGVLLCALVAAPVATPQGGATAPVDVEQHRINFNVVPGANGQFERMVVGDLDGDVLPDAVIVENGTPYFAWGAQVVSALSVIDAGLAGTTLDVAMRPDGLPDRQTLLVLQGGVGLMEYSFDENGPLTPVLRQAGLWTTHKRILVCDLDGQNGLDVLGLAADRKNLYALIAQPDGSFAPGLRLTYPSDVHSFTVGDWDTTDGVTNVAAVCGADLWVRKYGAAGITTFSGSLPGGFVTTLDESTPANRFAWVTRAAADDQYLLRVVEPPMTMSAPLGLLLSPGIGQPAVDVDVSEIVAGDIDGDGLDELLVAQRTFQRAFALVNLGGANPFSTADDDILVVESDNPSAAAGEVGLPSLGDLSNDGRADLVYGLGALNQVMVAYEFEPASQPSHDTTGYDNCDAVDPIVRPETDYELQTSQVDANFRVHLQIPFEHRTGFTHVQAALWKQPGPYANLNSAAEEQFLYEIDSTPTCRHMIEIDIDNGTPYDHWPNAEHYYVQYRFVNLNAAERVVEASRSYIVGMTLRPNTNPDPNFSYAAYLLSLSDESAVSPLVTEEVGGGQTAVVGAFVPLAANPNISFDALPNIPTHDGIRTTNPW